MSEEFPGPSIHVFEKIPYDGEARYCARFSPRGGFYLPVFFDGSSADECVRKARDFWADETKRARALGLKPARDTSAARAARMAKRAKSGKER